MGALPSHTVHVCLFVRLVLSTGAFGSVQGPALEEGQAGVLRAQALWITARLSAPWGASLAELRWCVLHIAAHFVVLLVDREEETVATCSLEIPCQLFVIDLDHTAADCLELTYKNRLSQLHIQINVKQAAKQCYSWMLMGPSVETTCANWVTALMTCLCLW